jgi:SagB-type dehydrogenase family enzyme
LRAPRTKAKRRAAPPTLSARLGGHITLEARPGGEIVAHVGGDALSLGKLSASAAQRALDLPTGLPLAPFEPGNNAADKELARLVRRLARSGLLEYCLGGWRGGDDQVVIEPQLPDYWPQPAQLGDADIVVLSRFAYMRRRGGDMVLESPRSGALFRICDPAIAASLAILATPQPVGTLRRREGFPGTVLIGLLADCHILFKVERAGDQGLRPAEGDDDLVLWDFHDLLFHTRSTEGRHANPLGGLYRYEGAIAPLPAVRSRWPGAAIDLGPFSAAASQPLAPAAKLLRDRHSTRSFDAARPITIAELSRFLDSTARVLSTFQEMPEDGGAGPVVSYTARPYPSGGASYPLELYLAVAGCEGLPQGFYHYDAGGHLLVPIAVRPHELDAFLSGAELAMGASAVPQILLTIAARFGRVSWKYGSIAYALILRDAGVLLQTFYLMATDMELGGCAIGSTNIELFAKMTALAFHVESPVAQFALGRPAPQSTG